MNATHDWSNQRNSVLVENTAQAVFKHLDRIRDNRALLGTRWIWELLQNARDVATEAGVVVSIEATGAHLMFRHNGKPFDVQDVLHLIYHGSTKVDLSGAVGRYGSGFISTHLLSPIVRLRGRLPEGEGFDFPIDRSGADVHALSEDMERSWTAFSASVHLSEEAPEFVAEFEYPLDDSARALVAAGLSQLETCASLVLAFSPEIARIDVCTQDKRWSISRSSSTRICDEVSLQGMDYRENGNLESRWVAASTRQSAAVVAIPLTGEPDCLRVALAPSIPRLYVLFPMVTTERLALPVAISSLQFKPREDRDGITLQGEAEGPSGNRRILDEACDDIGALLECGARCGWLGVEHLVSFDTSNVPDWVEASWYTQFMRRLLEMARRTPLVLLESGERIAPQDAWIPYGSDDEKCSAVASQGAGLSEVSAKLPRADLLPAWSRNVPRWAHLLESPPETLPGVLTLPRVAQRAAAAQTLDELQARLVAGVPVATWLTSLIEHLGHTDLATLFDELALLPDQIGSFHRRSELKHDTGIDDALKVIAAELDFDLRPTLLDVRIHSSVLADLLPTVSEDETLTDLIQHLRSRSDDGHLPCAIIATSVALFGWIVQQPDREHHLRGFPVATADDDGEFATVVELSRHPQPDERLIAPPECWPDALRPFVPLFPRRRILHREFGDARLATESWDLLERHGLLTLGPVFRTDRKATLFVPDDFITGDNEREHESTQFVALTQIAYLSGEDFSVLDTIRKSSSRASDFVRFLSALGESEDANPLETIPVQCECGHSHRAYRAAWLSSVRSRIWVPVGTDGKRTSKVSAESLAELLGNHPDVVQGLSQERGNALLTALEISPADFMLRMVAGEEDARVTLIRSMSDLRDAAGGDLDRVRDLVHEISEHPEILIHIERQREQRDRVSRNQEIGRLVETLLEEALASEGLSVRRTGVGSDYEVESDLVQEGQEVLLQVAKGESATLLEVKSTRTEDAKMTPRQAETALSNGRGFALCVVNLPDGELTTDLVRERCRFVFNIGSRLKQAWTQYESIQEATLAAQAAAGPITIDVVEGQYRFLIGREVWETGLTFQDAVGVLRGDQVTAD